MDDPSFRVRVVAESHNVQECRSVNCTEGGCLAPLALSHLPRDECAGRSCIYTRDRSGEIQGGDQTVNAGGMAVSVTGQFACSQDVPVVCP